MVQANQAVWGMMDEEIRCYKGPPSLAITEHWNYEDRGKDFFGGYCYMSQGPLPALWAQHAAEQPRACGASALIDEMENYNHQVGLKIVGEMLPQERNRVTLADEKDQYGLPIAARHLFLVRQRQAADRPFARLHAPGARGGRRAARSGTQTDDTCHLNGTARMGDDPRTSVVDADCRSWDIPQSLDLRRLGVPDRRRRQSVADDPGDRLPHRRPHQGAWRRAASCRRRASRRLARPA